MERKDKKRVEPEARVKKKSHDAPFGEEKHAFPNRGDRDPRQRDDALSRRQAEEGCEGECPAEELDRDLASRWGTRIASQPLLPAETIMRPLRTGNRRRRNVWAG